MKQIKMLSSGKWAWTLTQQSKQVSKVDSQKYLAQHLDSFRLFFNIHIKAVLTQVNRIMGLLQKFH